MSPNSNLTLPSAIMKIMRMNKNSDSPNQGSDPNHAILAHYSVSALFSVLQLSQAENNTNIHHVLVS